MNRNKTRNSQIRPARPRAREVLLDILFIGVILLTFTTLIILIQ